MIILRWVPKFLRFWEKAKQEDIKFHNAEEVRRLVFAMIPGGPIVDGISGYAARLHQSRAIDFADKLKEIMEEHYGGKISATSFKDEDFIEVMESVFSKVTKVKSEFKRDRFRNLLARQLNEPDDSQKTLKIVQLLNDLTDVQIILLDLIKGDHPYERSYNFRSELERFNQMMGEEPYRHTGRIELKIGSSSITVVDKEIDFYVNDLVVKGLILKNEKIKEDRGNRVPALRSTANNSALSNGIMPKLEAKYIISYIGLILLEKIQDFDEKTDASRLPEPVNNANL